ncbi:Aminopeptidase YpdF [Neomoorella glycerini]|uniref:Aminopeptidase YpdF n=1 Tax=Neomoorella glycerini TaxID=55779 RepID=A0A6I5ZM92_9FIRM|nr:Xaa-Pro peptidase family protein [Moorella glycerini]QGP90993.1 Aminopeptidase YpdF [Moorella glycerini]
MASFVGFLEPTRPIIDWQLLQELRWKRAREIMAAEGLDAILTNVVDNVIYLTGWPRHRTSVHPGSYAVLFLREQKEPVIFCSEGDSGAVKQDHFYSDIRVLPPWQNTWVSYFSRALEDYGLSEATVGLDTRMNASLYNGLVKSLPRVNFVNASTALNRMRMVKNPEEIKAYEYTVSLVEAGINVGIKACKESWGRYSEIEIAAMAQYELLRRGCHATDIWCTSGERTAPVRRFSSAKPVRGGELVVIDGPGSFNGFRAEFARTVWTGGRPGSEHKLLYRTIWEALEAAKEIMKPGTRTSDLEMACLRVVREAGLEDYYGGYPYTGHGMGIRQEQPYITARFPELDTELEEGMIINLEPALWKEGVGGVRLEDIYLITATGYRVLSRAPYEEDLLD